MPNKPIIIFLDNTIKKIHIKIITTSDVRRKYADKNADYHFFWIRKCDKIQNGRIFD